MLFLKLLYKPVIVILFLVSLISVLKPLLLSNYPDFSVYYYGSRIALNGGNFYIKNKDMFTDFVYPPFVAIFFAPLSIFPFLLASKIWAAVSIISLIMSLILMFKIFNQKLFSWEGIILSILAFIAFPIKFTLGMGQMNIIILTLFVLSVYLAENRKGMTSGIFLGLSIVLKLFPALLLFYFLITRRWRIVMSAFLVFAVSLLMSFLILRPEVNLFFINKILPEVFSGWKTDYYNQSLSGFLARTIETNQREIIRLIVSGILLLTALVIILKYNTMKNLDSMMIGILITVSLLINNFSWQHHFAWLIFPFFATFFFIKQNKLSSKYYAILFLSYILVAANLKNPENIHVVFRSHVFYGALALFFMDIYMILKTPIDKRA